MTDDAHRSGPAESPSSVVSRMYDVMLGGKDNFRSDREVRDRMLAIDPRMAGAAVDLRDFVVRVTRYLANAGITQFLQCGATLPTQENIHQVALRASSDASVVYVSRDPLALAHGRALMADNDHTHVVEADYRFPQQVLTHPVVTKHIDFTQPVVLYHTGTMRYVPDSDDPWGIMAAYVAALPSGSHVVFGHLSDPGPGHELHEIAVRARTVEREHGVTSHPRDRASILAMLDGLELLEPGLVPIADWWPDGPRMQPLGAVQRLALGAVGRKP